MSLRGQLIKPYAQWIASSIRKSAVNAVEYQHLQFRKNLATARFTAIGKEHRLSDVHHYHEFIQAVPIRDYEGHRPYIDKIIRGEKNVLWPGKPMYFAKTSGTTSGAKYIPLTRESLPNHFGTARNTMFNYMVETGNFGIMRGKMIFLSGSPKLEYTGSILTGRLSGIVNHQIPGWLRLNQLPSYDTNCIEDWETKLEAIVDETIDANMTLISGIPPWVQMYLERLLERSGKSTIKSLFPNLQVYVFGGVNYEPYRVEMEKLFGGSVEGLETYPASEGFIAFQDSLEAEGLLLNVNSGIFFEFVPADEIYNKNPRRFNLEQVETGVNYAIILSNNAGLWAYDIGDTVEFVSLDPPRLRVTGRTKHYISAFGEHVIAKEVEHALLEAANQFGFSATEFTVAPMVTPAEGLPYHEWLIEFSQIPGNLDEIARFMDRCMQVQNMYYRDLIKGKILKPLVITPLQKDSFIAYMRAHGKLGGQNKVPRLSNDRKIADALQSYALESA